MSAADLAVEDPPPPDAVVSIADAIRAQVRYWRAFWQWRQEDLADVMRQAGLPWSRVTVAQTERGQRHVTIEELIALAAVFAVPMYSLLSPPATETATERYGLRLGDRVLDARDVKAVAGGKAAANEDGWPYKRAFNRVAGQVQR